MKGMSVNMQNSIIIKIGICCLVIILILLLLYISKRKNSNIENEIIRNSTIIEYEEINNIDKIDEYQRRIYEESIS